MTITRYGSLDKAPVDHPRKFVVVVDDTPECRLALRFAAGRAAHSLGGSVLLVHVIRPPEFIQWGGVQDVMEQEARDRAQELMAALAIETEAYCGLRPDILIEQGKTADVILKILREEPGIFGLVLGASATGKPGPLIDFFSGEIAGSLPCPLVIVPGALSEGQVDQIV
jgi:nucleotide-binding universal stress UspA family protein